MVPGLSTATSAGVSSAGVISTRWLKASRDPEVTRVSHPPLLPVVSTTRHYLEMGPNRIKSQMGTNILILTRNPAQVMATLYHPQRGEESKRSSAQLCCAHLCWQSAG